MAAARVGAAAGAGRRSLTANRLVRIAAMDAAERLQDLAHRLSEDSATLVRAEIQLAKAEVREKTMALGRAAAFGAVAAVLSLFALFALVQALIDALDVAMPNWLAALLVGVILLAVAGVLGLLAMRAAKRGSPPVPEKAVAEARAVADELREARS